LAIADCRLKTLLSSYDELRDQVLFNRQSAISNRN